MMKAIHLFILTLLLALSGPAWAVLEVDILDCGGLAIELCGVDDDCAVSAEGFLIVAKATDIGEIENLIISGYSENNPAVDFYWKYSCDGSLKENAEWVRPSVFCAPGRTRQMTFIVEIGPLGLVQREIADLVVCAENATGEVCDRFDQLVIDP